MICLRCGHCCINYDVIIVDNPLLGIVEGNLKHKPSGERCPHLLGSKMGEYSCGVHDKDWYKETPCYDFGQIEYTDFNCRIGEYMLSPLDEYL